MSERMNCGYLDDGGEPLHIVYQPAVGQACGTVLLCSALCLEATHAASVWKRWARQLAHAGWNTVRFDWGGTGESSGDFTEMTFEHWRTDLQRIYEMLAASNHCPIVLLGLRGGSLLAAHAFDEGIGRALVLWEAPVSGRAHLMEVLRRKLAADYALGTLGTRKTRDDYIAELQAGEHVEVEGFRWTKSFWDSFCKVELPAVVDGRPTVHMSSRSHSAPCPPFWQDSSDFRPAISEWSDATLAFLDNLDRIRPDLAGFPRLQQVARFATVERQLLSVRYETHRLAVTHHAPAGPSAAALVFPNFGYVPRSGQAGIAARICDEVARRGVHGLRVDMPALGDSEGELPEYLPEWAEGVRAGSLAAPVLAAIADFRQRLGIERVILGGLCAASITALYAFNEHPNSLCGLVLLEPELFTGESVARQDEATDGRRSDRRSTSGWFRIMSSAHRVFTGWGWMRVITGENESARGLPLPRGLVRRLFLIQKDSLPARTNLPLVAAWQTAIRCRIPMLVMTAHGGMRELFFERVNLVVAPDYVKLVGAGRAIEHVRVPGTNHNFTAGKAIDCVTAEVVKWVERQTKC